jgi:hypothetical protein
MMLGPVHMAEGHRHHLFYNSNGAARVLGKTQTDDAVHSRGVALAAYIVAVYASSLALLLLVANGTLHGLILRQIFQRGFAD